MLNEELKLSHFQTGLLFSLFYYTYAAGQVPSGVVIDRFGPHRFLTTIIALWSVALVAITQTKNMILLGSARFLFGATQAGCYPALTNLSRSWFPIRHRTLMQGLVATTSGRAGGAMSSIVLMTFLMGYAGYNWRTAVTIIGLFGGVLSLLVWFLLRNSPRDDARVNSAERDLILDQQESTIRAGSRSVLPFGQALKNSSMRWFTVQQFLDAGSDVAFVSLIGKYFLLEHSLDFKQAGWLTSLPLWGGALGGIVGGWLNDRLIRETGNRRWVRSGVGFVGKMIGCAMLIALILQDAELGAGLCLFFAKFFSDWSQPTTWGTCTDLGGRYSATVFGIINTAGTLGGAAMPVIFGKILDLFTTKLAQDGVEVAHTDWVPLFALLATMYFLSGACWLLVDCTKTIREE